MPLVRVVAGFVLLTLVAGACQDPANEATDEPIGSPVAPAVEPTHPDAERTLPLPSDAPIAPAVEPTHPDAEETIPLPSDAPVAPAIEPAPTGPDPTIDFEPD